MSHFNPVQLFRVLLPSWKFFDGVVDAPDLWYRTSHDGISFGTWTLCIPKTESRSWKKLWINTDENFHFAGHALLEYFKNDLQLGDDPSLSLELVNQLVRYQVRQRGNEKYFQYVLNYSPTEAGAIYYSKVTEVQE